MWLVIVVLMIMSMFGWVFFGDWVLLRNDCSLFIFFFCGLLKIEVDEKVWS